jgi:hypothetical protein
VYEALRRQVVMSANVSFEQEGSMITITITITITVTITITITI